MTGLLERERELASATQVLDAAGAGDGRVLVIEAPAGIGKTALLSAVQAVASDAGMNVLRARAGELEADLSFGVTRQLLTRAVAREPEELLRGAAALAGPLLGFQGSPPGGGGDPLAAALHGLHWLCAELALRRPLLVAVDDVHWADTASLRFLAYLARRLDGLPLVMAVAIRSGEPCADQALLDLIAHDGGSTILRPGPLSHAGTAALVSELAPECSEAVVAACFEATGGNPFLIRELIGSLPGDLAAVTPKTLGEMGAEAVARSVFVRLGRLPDSCADLARAVALFPEGALFRHVAALAGLDQPAAATAADRLVEAQVLAPGQPLAFLHPLLRTAIYQDLAPAGRAQAHARAAELLLTEGASPEAVSAHLLAVEPAGRSEAVEVLVAAAGQASAVGAVEAAVRCLARALEEPPTPEALPGVLHKLGMAELLAGRPAALGRLQDAVERATDPEVRAAAALDLGRALGHVGQPLRGADAIDLAIAALEATDEDRLLRYHAEALWLEWLDPDGNDRFNARLDALPADLPGDTLAQQLILCYQAHRALTRLERYERVRELASRALADGRLFEAGLDAAPPSSFAIWALALADGLHEAREATAAMTRRLGATGALIGVPMGHAHQAELAVMAGDLREAETEARLALAALDGQDEHHPGWRWARAGLIAALLEQGRLEDAELECPEDELELEDSFTVTLVAWRARVRAAQRRLDLAAIGFERVGAWASRMGLRDPYCEQIRWRGDLALVRHRQGQDEEARELAGALLADARRGGAPRAVGEALRAAALVSEPDRQIELLREAIEHLATSPGRLLHAQALIDLGSVLRRQTQPAAARDPLRQGVDLARRCGADVLAARGEDELVATGARRLRRPISGLEALTPSELRIARLAADGPSNREIAETQFLSVKTVEMHLGRVYRKLDIHSREDLTAALREPSAVVVTA